MPDWQMGNEEDAYFGEPDDRVFVDPDGNPSDGRLHRRSRPGLS